LSCPMYMEPSSSNKVSMGILSLELAADAVMAVQTRNAEMTMSFRSSILAKVMLFV